MSRTDLEAATLAAYLRQMCGDGSVEWCYEPMQTSVLLDMADMLDENARLRKELASVPRCETCDAMLDCDECQRADESHKERRQLKRENAKLRELVGNYASMAEYLLARQPMLFAYKAKELQELDEKRRELGIEVTE